MPNERGPGRGVRKGFRGSGSRGRSAGRAKPPQTRSQATPKPGQENPSKRHEAKRFIRGRGCALRRHGPQSFSARLGLATDLQILNNLLAFGNAPDQLVVQLTETRGQLQQIVNSRTLQSDTIQKIILIFARACPSSSNACLIQALSVLSDSTFLKKHLPNYLLIGCAHQPEESRREVAMNLLILFEEYMSRFPSQICNLPIDSLTMFVVKMKGGHELQGKLSGVTSMRNQIVRQLVAKSDRPCRNLDERESPPENFRQLSTCPTEEDINQTKASFLRKIRAQGKYQDGNDYLDVLFRLMREDLVAPLREGILEIKHDVAFHERKFRLKVYKGVTLLFPPKFSHSGVTYNLKFSIKELSHVQWDKSKRLKFGSLLCISRDDFNSAIFATVAESNPKGLSKGCLNVLFFDRTASVAYMKESPSLKMVESESYFEAYRYVLDALKTMDADHIPMGRYIVDANVDVRVPRYLAGKYNPTYNLSKVLNNKQADQVKVLDSDAWPEHKSTLFNSSQLEAIKHALTKEFVLVQGPPGTGKTFVGLRIARALLENKGQNSNLDERPTPILVVCYTNHALDQFLSGLIRAGFRSLLRVGGRADEELQGFSLQAAREGKHRSLHRSRTNRLLDEELEAAMAERRDARKRIKFLEKACVTLMEQLHELNASIDAGKLIDLTKLRQYGILSEYHSEWFEFFDRKCRSLNISLFEIFLGVIREPLESLFPLRTEDTRMTSSSSQHADDVIDVQEDECILIEQYADVNESYGDTSSKLSPQMNMEESFVFTDSQGFRFVQQTDLKRKENVQHELLKSVPMSNDEVEAVDDPWGLSLCDRWRLYSHWINALRQRCTDWMEASLQAYQFANDELRSMDMILDEKRFLMVDLIGMTTSCAARYYDALNSIRPRVVIVEEAAEVLEAHVVTALTAGAEHVILIGDHKQLRPNPSVYDLETKYNLSLSLFERMVINKLDCMTLNVQHRMRPQFARLLRHIYPKLENHPSVEVYENIAGVEKNMYFINHQRPEVEDAGLRSKANHHEAHFVKGLCLYLIQQGYKTQEITILTGYTGQVLKIRSLMTSDQFKGVKITSVDNFQGEESEIILLSLVRSNAQEKIGFWKADNRTCVALSRAKKGMYVIGNFEVFSKCSLLWARIVNDARSMDCYGDNLLLTCQNHPSTKTKVCSEADFAFVPEGGCRLTCAFRLPCGHVCTRACHPTDGDHVKYECRKRCPHTSCEKGHPCSYTCHHNRKCPACLVPVDLVLPSCGHTQPVPCSEDALKFRCRMPCPRKLPCGHDCRGKCGDDCNAPCTKPLKKALPCGHECTAPCWQDVSEVTCTRRCGQLSHCEKGHPCSHICHHNRKCPACLVPADLVLPSCGHTQPVPCSEDVLNFRCRMPCPRKLPCGHNCRGKCGDDCNTPCTKPVKKALPCGHECTAPCWQDVSEVRCTNRCGKILNCGRGHVCRYVCHYGKECRTCQVLVFRVLPKCGHTQRTPCSADELTTRCEMPCPRKLTCGHDCRGMCGEPCDRPCKKPIKTTLSCGHECTASCSQDISNVKCKRPCDQLLRCGHPCSGVCEKCKKDKLHVKCSSKCEHTIVCSSLCKQSCHADCLPCNQPCQNECPHQKCNKKCMEPCVPCMKPCLWSCPHQKCNRLCYEICDREPCNEPCNLLLKCNHPCIGLCSEPCPSLCRLCDEKEVTSVFFGTEDKPDARFVQLEDCKHVLEVGGMDVCMGKNENDSKLDLKTCPRCRTPIRRSCRYMVQVKTALTEINEAKKKAGPKPGFHCRREALLQKPDVYSNVLPPEMVVKFESLKLSATSPDVSEDDEYIHDSFLEEDDDDALSF